ncbi:hypothetical protein LOTGIDRAFT_169642 [Lottia gigantea]|uniref:Receptor-binding cancer antigen expressed on SiSo cells n=1 Tax=Lottia gigantea TaxID=225164 RepID=V3ZQR1_LOTGI|nr:hypothetical protein LOTGIDRAFT_169642 [Lottia gigantea]ESO83231.1 hypothetical protein LOTGIDRAFT_169642 [Lottia gigantea]
MKALINIIKSIFNLIRYLLSPLKRAVCRRRRSSESDFAAPVTDLNSLSIDMTQSYPGNNDIQMEPWDSWNDAGTNNRSNNNYGNPTQQYINNYRQNLKKPEPEPVPEPDYFEDMEPSLRKTAKIHVKKKHAADNNINKSAISNRLAMTSDIPLQTGSELDAWEDENNAWDEVGDEDLSYEAEVALKDKRRAERQQRQLEHQKRKLEKESRLNRKDRDIVAVKLS